MIRERILKVLRKITGEKNIQIEFPENESFGDYSSNVAMAMFSSTKYKVQSTKFKNPREMAEEIVANLNKVPNLAKIVDKIEVAGGGFINFWLSKETLVNNLEAVLKDEERYGMGSEGRGKTVVIDYSSPNIAKRFGIGHLRSTVIGQALYNLYKFLDYKVIGDNHLGDWGTQFGTLLYQVTSNKLQVTSLNIDKLEELYVDFNKKAQDNPKLWDEARAWFRKLEEGEGDGEARKIWKAIVEVSLAEFERIYKLLGVKIDVALGESFYEEAMPAVIEELSNKKLLVDSQGAKIVEPPGLPPAIVVKSDGTTTYFTRDLATIKYRIEKWDPNLFIYEVGSDQTLHFRQLFKTAEALGWKDSREFVHVAHGLIRFEHGKMSTRRGQTVKLEEVLNEAVQRARKIIDKSETGRGLTEREKEEIVGKVGIGSVKYFDLMHHPTTDIIFDWDKLFVLEGDSGPYLQYTVARTNSVLVKSSTTFKDTVLHGGYSNLNEEELGVLRTLCRFSDIIVDAAKNYSPNLLCNYLFDLAQKYNNFYAQHRILPDKSKSGFRIALTSATGQVLKNGLNLLGIKAPERM